MSDPTLPNAPAPRPAAHCSDEELNDHVDARQGPAARARVAGHCAECAECGARLAALERVVAAARAAPPAVLPPDPDALLRAVEARVRAAELAPVRPVRPVRPVPAEVAPASRAPRPALAITTVGGRRTALRAAAVAAVVAGGALAAAELVRRDAPAAAVVRQGAPATAAAPAPAPARDETDLALAPLRAAADGGDRVLAAAALRALQPSLAAVDAAIAEAEAALARDPKNSALAELLARTQERRRELVRRGAFLGSRA